MGGGIVHMLLPSLADCWHKAFPEDNQPKEDEGGGRGEGGGGAGRRGGEGGEGKGGGSGGGPSWPHGRSPCINS